MSIKLKTTDSKDKIRYTVQGIDYRPLSLEGATVRFLMADKVKKTLILNESATIASASEGTVEYKLSDLSTLYPGTFNAEFHVEFADGSRKIVPAHGYIEVTISESLDASQTGEIEENIILEVSKIEEFKDEIVAEVDGFRTTIGQAQDATLEAHEQAEYAKTQGDRAKVEADRLVGTDVSVLDNKVNDVTAQLAEKVSQDELEIERQRISNLTANAGDTDGNAELLDIRVGFDGIVYDTAGDATRALGSYMTENDQPWEVS